LSPVTARHRVGGLPGREADDDAHRAFGPRRAGQAGQAGGRRGGGQQEMAAMQDVRHCCS
jgi:hypothetical protein